MSLGYVHKVLTRITETFEIVVIDDCSTDGTTDVVRKLADEYEEIVPIYHTKNRGVGDGLRDGFKAARYKYVLTNCADLPFDVADLEKAIPFFEEEGADGCIMVRFDRSANTWFRKITSFVNYLIIKLLFRLPFEDYNFVQLYKNELVKKISLESKDVFVPPEMIIKSHDLGFKLVQFKAKFHERKAGYSKYGHPKYFIITFLDQIRFWYILRIRRKHLHG